MEQDHHRLAACTRGISSYLKILFAELALLIPVVLVFCLLFILLSLVIRGHVRW